MRLATDWIGDWIDLDGVDDRELDATLTRIGHAVEGVEQTGNGRSLDLEITTNRIDAMSHRGMARELAAAFDRDLREIDDLVPVEGLKEFDVDVRASRMCGRFAALAIDGVKVGPSSKHVQARLESAGLRPINNVVDATNYVMLDLGHPLHAFDRDRLEQDRIVVRAGGKGETLRTLDGVDRVVDEQTVVIADGARGIALGGIMGGENSEIGPATTRVVLECAWFDPVTIRMTSRRLKLRTDASYRFERRVDPMDAAEAIRRCAALIIEQAGGTPVAFTDRIGDLPESGTTELRAARISLFSGGAVGLEESRGILSRLGMKIEAEADRLIVGIPSWRGDVTAEIDLIEEVLRIHGYDRIAPALPRLSTGDVRRDDERALEELVRDTLASIGLSEVVTYSFLKPEQLTAISDEKPLMVENALTENTSAMRTSMIAGLLDAAASNWARGNREGSIFEVGRTYHDGGDHVEEVSRAGLLLWGTSQGHWDEKGRTVDYYDGRGVVDELASRLGTELRWKAASAPWAREGRTAEAWAGAERAAIVGVVDSPLASEIGMRTAIVAAEVNLRAFAGRRPDIDVQDVSRFPGVPMAFAFRHAPELEWSEITEAVEKNRPEELADFGLWDRFEEERGEKIKTTLAMWYQANDRSLSQEEVEELHGHLKKVITERLPIEAVSE